jgi:hypothetical protein
VPGAGGRLAVVVPAMEFVVLERLQRRLPGRRRRRTI